MSLGRPRENSNRRVRWRLAVGLRRLWRRTCAWLCGGLVYGCAWLRKLGKRCSRMVGSQWGARNWGNGNDVMISIPGIPFSRKRTGKRKFPSGHAWASLVCGKLGAIAKVARIRHYTLLIYTQLW
jgi:hypothetical protein